MAPTLLVPPQARHVVAIIGGAVAGSEAAALCAARGITAIVIEQNDRPFGKIEDGLPRWHDKLRQKEYQHITENLSAADVLFLPRTTLGKDVTLDQLRKDWGVSAVLLASGAWRDRPLFDDAERYLGRGLINQNALVNWYNHYPEQDYQGERYEVRDNAVVVGGGLASIDVVKIISIELYKQALAARGKKVTSVELEHDGIPATLAKHNLTAETLGLQGVTLFYRREKTAMPIAQAPDNATPQQLEKVGQVRAKLMDKVMEKYLVHFHPNAALESPIVENDKLVGLRFQPTKTVDGKLIALRDEHYDVRSPFIVSSIGSIPLSIPGLPMKGELIDFEDFDTGKVRGFDNVFGLGNALTGKGNIKDSRKSSAEVSARMVDDYLFGTGTRAYESLHHAAQDNAERVVDAAQALPKVAPQQLTTLYERVQQHWQRTDYPGDIASWLKRVERNENENA
jgi:ferredoxin/flavodoxin---NADP+ reductase